MKRFLVRLFTLVAVIPGVTGAADDPKQKQDLTAVIALQGKPCGEVVSYVTQGDKHFIATCKDGNRYRVHVQDGRVVVEKR